VEAGHAITTTNIYFSRVIEKVYGVYFVNCLLTELWPRLQTMR